MKVLMCWAQVDFADKNTVLMLEIWRTLLIYLPPQGALRSKLLRAPSCSVTPLPKMLATVVEIQSKNAMHLSVQTSVSILVSLRSARSAAKEAHITSQNATQCTIPLPCLAPWPTPTGSFVANDVELAKFHKGNTPGHP